jgi:hypothetical protein
MGLMNTSAIVNAVKMAKDAGAFDEPKVPTSDRQVEQRSVRISNGGVNTGGTPYGPSAVSSVVDVNADKWKGIM